MADNVILNAGVGGDSIAADEIAGVKHQRVKVQYGIDGAAVDCSPANRLPIAELYRDIVVDGVTGYGYAASTGRNTQIDIIDTPADVWNGGGPYTGHPDHADSAETVEVFSSDVNDNAGGTGARSVRLIGLGDDWAAQTEDITLHASDGTIPEAGVSLWRRLPEAYVLTAGSSDQNEGILTVRHTTTTANVFIKMPALKNKTTIAAYTVPAGKTGYIISWAVDIGRTSGSGGSAEVDLQTRQEGGLWLSQRSKYVTTESGVEPPFKFPIQIPEKTDVRVRVFDVSDNDTQVSSEYDILLVDN